MAVGNITLRIKLPGCRTLKEKRSRIAPILHQLHEKFNLSVSEIDQQDLHQQTVIACALVANEHVFIEKSLHEVVQYLESHWPDEILYSQAVEIY